MKKILFSLFIALTAVAFTGCEELFLGTEAIVGHTYEWESSNGRDELRIEFMESGIAMVTLIKDNVREFDDVPHFTYKISGSIVSIYYDHSEFWKESAKGKKLFSLTYDYEEDALVDSVGEKLVRVK